MLDPFVFTVFSCSVTYTSRDHGPIKAEQNNRKLYIIQAPVWVPLFYHKLYIQNCNVSLLPGWLPTLALGQPFPHVVMHCALKMSLKKMMP